MKWIGREESSARISFSFRRKKRPELSAEPSVGLKERLKQVNKKKRERNDEWDGGRVLGTINFSSHQLVLIDVGDRSCKKVIKLLRRLPLGRMTGHAHSLAPGNISGNKNSNQ